MTPTEHAAVEAALKAKRAAAAKAQGLHTHAPRASTSSTSRIVALVVWLLALGSLVALFYMNRA